MFLMPYIKTTVQRFEKKNNCSNFRINYMLDSIKIVYTVAYDVWFISNHTIKPQKDVSHRVIWPTCGQTHSLFAVSLIINANSKRLTSVKRSVGTALNCSNARMCFHVKYLISSTRQRYDTSSQTETNFETRIRTDYTSRRSEGTWRYDDLRRSWRQQVQCSLDAGLFGRKRRDT